jgi:hypothetical protein
VTASFTCEPPATPVPDWDAFEPPATARVRRGRDRAIPPRKRIRERCWGRRLALYPALTLGLSPRPESGQNPFRATPSPAWLGKVARSAGWGVGRRCDVGRIAGASSRSRREPVPLSTPHPSACGRHLPRCASRRRGACRSGVSDAVVRRSAPAISRKSPPASLDWPLRRGNSPDVGPGFVRGASGFVTERLTRG